MIHFYPDIDQQKIIQYAKNVVLEKTGVLLNV